MEYDDSENNEPSDFHRGESSETRPFEGINDPLRFVDRFRKHREQSVREVVLSATAVCDGIDEIGDDAGQLGRYLTALAEAKVISKAEAKKADLSKMSMISKIRKIHKHRKLILHPNIADKICTGYSVLYELGKLIDDLPDDSDAADQLGKLLETLDGSLTRKWIQDLREQVAPKQRGGKPSEDGAEQHGSGDEVSEELAEESADHAEDDASPNAAVVLAKIERPDVVVMNVGEPITAALLVACKGDEGALTQAAQEDRWRQMSDQMAEDSALFIFVPLQVLLNIGSVLATFGLFRCTNVYLLSEPNKLEATRCNVLAIFESGEGVDVRGVPNWNADDTPTYIAEQFLQGVPGRRMQFYASAPAADWEALTNDQE